MFLTPDEIRQLTNKQRKPAQVAALRHMGIEHKIRPDGSLAVLNSHIEKQFDGFSKADKTTETAFKMGDVR